MDEDLFGVVVDFGIECIVCIIVMLLFCEGVILLVIIVEYNDNFIQCLMIEKIISIDIMVLGGNILLMILVEDDE